MSCKIGQDELRVIHWHHIFRIQGGGCVVPTPYVTLDSAALRCRRGAALLVLRFPLEQPAAVIADANPEGAQKQIVPMTIICWQLFRGALNAPHTRGRVIYS